MTGNHPFRAFFNWYRINRERTALALLEKTEVHRLARDLNLSVEDLGALVSQSEDEAALLGRMMQLHGIDKAALQAELPALVREMTATCAHCDAKDQCAHDLDRNATTEQTDQYCPNASTMRSLREGKSVQKTVT